MPLKLRLINRPQVHFDDLLRYENGQPALADFTEKGGAVKSEDEDDYSLESDELARPKRSRVKRPDNVDTVEALDELEADNRPTRKSKRKSKYYDNDSDSEVMTRRRSTRTATSRSEDRPSIRRSGRSSLVRNAVDPSADEEDDDGFVLQSDILPHRKRKRPARISYAEPQFIDDEDDEDDGRRHKAPKLQRQGVRQSGRSTRYEGDMQDPGVNDIYRSDSEPRALAPPKPVGPKEYFKELPRSDPFRARHMQQCDSCKNGTNFAPLIYCQGCTFAYHKSCISHRSNREHLVTKVDHKHFVLQCRRCVAYPRRKDHTAPDQGRCSDCKEPGLACTPFRERKTTVQEQRDREENGGDDPIYPVEPDLINDPENVMFRCTGCFRGFHFEHLPSKSANVMDLDGDDAASQRFLEYSQDWQCYECATVPAKVGGIVAWKPIDEDNYDAQLAFDMINEDDKAYLLRWEGKSYFQATWMPGPWVWGYTSGTMRKAFAKRDEARLPKMRTEDAIPEDYLRADIVLDVKYTSIVDIPGEEIDKARIRKVDQALIKFKGLGYEDAVWEKPPTPDDEERWTDFVTAYNDWILGKYVKQPKTGPMKVRLEKARATEFLKLEKKKQPDNIIGGELMKYQMEGLNWLFYKWFAQKNAVLADEMGLGKTIQIIGFLATLVKDLNCFPFLVVVPNSTCANWRREVKKWAPSLRVVAYFGSKEARDLTMRYELFARESKELRCHVVVTSCECAADDSTRRFFRSIPWQALIIDEGQRLKSDKTLLYSSLAALKIPFKILLTGTPLQNNARELFNLLQFLDDTVDAAELEQRFLELNATKIAELHEMIRPFFLRRTKAQVLTFLPPMAQIIVPVSMSTLQKKLYKSILGKNPDLLRAIFGGARELSSSQRASLNNILMQLRKCLCHPFVYNQGIEERDVSHSVSHRNLVEASGKLQMLELLLPKLKERGHRVLIFSQFLDMLNMVEDFMDGMEMQYQRLDGSMSSLKKQKRIDEFNAPDSPLFAFLLSTRAGGVGINLATADTVIIMDPDFNPHQDIQALSRAHRIGQKKKVLCIQLVTRASAEEKIMQYGRKKMALDHVLIEQMDAEDATDRDLEGILRHGAAELFDDDGEKDIKYDDAAIDKLLEASNVESTKAGADKSAESTFSFARVWANNDFEESLHEVPEAEETAPDPSVWDKILKERERVAAAEAAAAQQALGRGRRAKQVNYDTDRMYNDMFVDTEQNVDYAPDLERGEGAETGDAPEGTAASPVPSLRRGKKQDESDTDFQADSDVESVAEEAHDESIDPNELQTAKTAKTSKLAGKKTSLSQSRKQITKEEATHGTPRGVGKNAVKAITTPPKLKGKAGSKPKTPKTPKTKTPRKKASTPVKTVTPSKIPAPHNPSGVEPAVSMYSRKRKNEMAMMQGVGRDGSRFATAAPLPAANYMDVTTAGDRLSHVGPIQASQPTHFRPPQHWFSQQGFSQYGLLQFGYPQSATPQSAPSPFPPTQFRPAHIGHNFFVPNLLLQPAQSAQPAEQPVSYPLPISNHVLPKNQSKEAKR